MIFNIDATYCIRIIIALCLTLVAVFTDLKSYRIPNKIGMAGMVVALLLLLPEVVYGDDYIKYIYGVLAGFIVMLGLYIVGAVGAGDVKLMSVLGALLGIRVVVMIIAVAMVCAVIVGIVEIIANRRITVVSERGLLRGAQVHRMHFTLAVIMSEIVVMIAAVIIGG